MKREYQLHLSAIYYLNNFLFVFSATCVCEYERRSQLNLPNFTIKITDGSIRQHILYIDTLMKTLVDQWPVGNCLAFFYRFWNTTR